MQAGETNPDALNWDRLEELFSAAIEVPRHRQAAFIEQKTADAPQLRKRLQALLDHDSGAAHSIR